MRNNKITNFKRRPEDIIQEKIIRMMTLKGWYIKPTHGTVYSKGWPDLYACKRGYGQRWIEVKNPDRTGEVFEASQLQDFHRFTAEGIGVWVMVSDSESEYKKLFGPANWHLYLGIYK